MYFAPHMVLRGQVGIHSVPVGLLSANYEKGEALITTLMAIYAATRGQVLRSLCHLVQQELFFVRLPSVHISKAYTAACGRSHALVAGAWSVSGSLV